MRVEKPLQLFVGGVSIVVERLGGAILRRAEADHPEPIVGSSPAPDGVPVGGAHVLLGSLAALARAGAAIGQQTRRMVRRHEPRWGAADVSARGRARIASLAALGAEVERRLRARAGRALEDRLGQLAAGRPVSVAVDTQLDRLLEPLVDRALPIVLDRLGQRREQVRGIVWEHGEDLTGEVVAGLRDRAAAADATAERIARRLLSGRRGRSVPDEHTRAPAPPG